MSRANNRFDPNSPENQRALALARKRARDDDFSSPIGTIDRAGTIHQGNYVRRTIGPGKGRPGKGITVNGIAFDSFAAAGRELHIGAAVLQMAAAEGRPLKDGTIVRYV